MHEVSPVRYRLNPLYFLSDRKLWCLSALAIAGVGAATSVHPLLLSSVWASGAGDASLLSWSVGAALVLCALMAVRFVPVFLHDALRGAVVVRRYSPDLDDWGPILGGHGDARDLAEFLGVPGADGPIEGLLSSLEGAIGAVRSQVARAGGVASSAVRVPPIDVVLTPWSGAPYGYRQPFGRYRVVVPVRGLVRCWEDQRDEGIGFLLRHEFAHAVGSEGGGLSADANLASWAYASRLHVGVLTLILLPVTALAAYTHNFPAPPLLLLLALFALLPPVIAVLNDLGCAIEARRSEHGTRLRRALQLMGCGVCLLGGAILTLGDRFADGSRAGVAAGWFAPYVTLALGWLLAFICERIGRRQMEFIADELAASAMCKGPGPRLPSEARAMARSSLSTLQAGGASSAPGYALGAYEDVPGLEGEVGSSGLGRAWTWTDVWRTHPALEERRLALLDPSRQVCQPLGPALLAIVVGAVVLPAVTKAAAVGGGVGGAASEAAGGVLSLLFLWLLVLTARRPAIPGPGSVQVGNSGIPGLGAEVVTVLLGTAVPSVLSSLLLTALGLEGDLPFVQLPPVGPVVLAATYYGVLSGAYLLVRFTRLGHWHYCAGLRWGGSFAVHTLMFLRSALLSVLTLTVLAVAGALLEVLLRGWQAGGSEWLSWLLATRRGYADEALGAGAVVLVFGLCHAAVVAGAPARPRRVDCPLGHSMPAPFHHLFTRPENGDYAWSHCPDCGRSPAEGGILVPEDGSGAIGWSTRPILVAVAGTILGLQALAVLLAGLPDLLTLGVHGRCESLAAIASAPDSGLFADCQQASGDVNATERPPRPVGDGEPGAWAATFQSATPEVPMLPLYATMIDASLTGSLGVAALAVDTMSCATRLSEYRNRVAYVEACAVTPQAPDEATCASALDHPDDVQLQCECLWAPAANQSRITRATRTRAAAALYGWVHGFYHEQVAEQCSPGSVPLAWSQSAEHLDRWMDEGVAFRMFLAAARAERSDRWFGAEAPPAPPDFVCQKHLQRAELDQLQSDVVEVQRCQSGDSQLTPEQCENQLVVSNVRESVIRGCLSGPNLMRIEAEADVALALYEANECAFGGCGRGSVDRDPNRSWEVVRLLPLADAPLRTMKYLRQLSALVRPDRARWRDATERADAARVAEEAPLVRELLDELHERSHDRRPAQATPLTWMSPHERESLCAGTPLSDAPERWIQRVACSVRSPASDLPPSETPGELCAEFHSPRSQPLRDTIEHFCEDRLYNHESPLSQGNLESCFWHFGAPIGCDGSQVAAASEAAAARMFADEDFIGLALGTDLPNGSAAPATAPATLSRIGIYFAALRARVTCRQQVDSGSDPVRWMFEYAACSRLQLLAAEQMGAAEAESKTRPVPLEVLRGLTDPGSAPNFHATLAPGEFKMGWHTGWEGELKDLTAQLAQPLNVMGDTERLVHYVRIDSLDNRAAAAAVFVGSQAPFSSVADFSACLGGRTRLASMDQCRQNISKALLKIFPNGQIDVTRCVEQATTAVSENCDLASKRDLYLAGERDMDDAEIGGPPAEGTDDKPSTPGGKGDDRFVRRESTDDRAFRLQSEWSDVPELMKAERWRVPEFLNARFIELRRAWELPALPSLTVAEGS